MGPPLKRRVETIGPTDHKRQPLRARTFKRLGEGQRVVALALLAQGHQLLAAAQLSRYGLRLAGHATVPQLHDLQAREPLAINLYPFAHPALAHLADGNDAYAGGIDHGLRPTNLKAGGARSPDPTDRCH